MFLTERGNSVEALYFDPRDTTTNRRMRRSVGTASRPVSVQYNDTSTKKLRLLGDLANYLKASPDSSSLAVGPHGADDPQVCFKMHSFIVPSAEDGKVVIIETNDGRYVTKDSANSESVTLVAGVAPQQTTITDDRFFDKLRAPGDQNVTLRHRHSRMYLSATQSGVSLVSSTTDNLPDSTFFKEFDCTHT